MDARNDTPAFQQSLMEILYLWMKCSFQRGTDTDETHFAWAYQDPQGRLFALCFASVNSTLLIRMSVEKTDVLSYLMHVLSHRLSLSNNIQQGAGMVVVKGGVQIDNIAGLVM
jgi:hypothetical protein